MNSFSRLRAFALPLAAVALTVVPAVPAHAVNKDMVQLQTQVQQLQDAIARLQQSNDERMGVLKDLVQQTADSVNKMSTVVSGLQQKMAADQDAMAAKNDQLSGQVQSLNDSLDELKARLARMEKSLGNIQSQQQSMAAVLNNLPQTNQGGANPGMGPQQTPPQDNTTLPPPNNPQGPAQVTPIPVVPQAGGNPGTQTASPSDLYGTAYRDYMSAKYVPAAQEFQTLIQAYPDDNLSGNAYFYLGEINIRTQKPSAAVKDYDHVLEHYPDNQKVPASHLHKADALIAVGQKDAGVRELRALIQRFPNSPESAQARSKLSAMGVKSAAR